MTTPAELIEEAIREGETSVTYTVIEADGRSEETRTLTRDDALVLLEHELTTSTMALFERYEGIADNGGDTDGSE